MKPTGFKTVAVGTWVRWELSLHGPTVENKSIYLYYVLVCLLSWLLEEQESEGCGEEGDCFADGGSAVAAVVFTGFAEGSHFIGTVGGAGACGTVVVLTLPCASTADDLVAVNFKQM